MKRLLLIIGLSIFIIAPAISQKKDNILYCKKASCIFENCSFLHTNNCDLNIGIKVHQIGKICTDNEDTAPMINIETLDGKHMIGWVYAANFCTHEEYLTDSIENQKNELLLKEVERKEDSIKAIKEKIKYSKPFWIEEVKVIQITDETSGISVGFLNTSKNTIKYINFTAIPYNTVDDPVIDDVGNSSKSCQLIGPIEPDEFARYEKEILFFSGIISYYKLKNISVQYMDNSIKYFNYNDILKKKGSF